MRGRVTRVPLLLCAFLMLAPALAFAQQAEEKEENLLTVSGSGEARITPDRALVSVGVETRHARAGEAIQENNRLMQAVIQAIRRLNIPERDIRTASYNVSRQYEPDPADQRRPARPIFVVRNIASVRLEDPARAGAVIDAATGAGANVVEGVSFISEQEMEARQQALRDAVREARQKAETIAQALGVRLAGIESVVESGGPVPIPQPFRVASVVAADQAAAPILPGENVIRANVVIRFRLAQ